MALAIAGHVKILGRKMITIEWNSRGEKRPSFHFLAFDSASASAVILIDDLAILVPRDGVGVYACEKARRIRDR